jgi:hypothetical protein
MRLAMTTALLALTFVAAAIGPAGAQQAEPGAKKAAAAKSKAAPGIKTCNYKFPDGERRTWSCHKEEPCCAWDAIKYVKCGSTITNCL